MTGNTLIEVRVTNDIEKYLKLKSLGYHTRWVGEGVVCLGKIVKTTEVDSELALIN